MFEEEDALPRPELKTTVSDRDCLTGASQHHSDMRGGIIGTFGGVSKVAGVFRHETFKEFLQINSRGVIGVFKDHQAGARMLEENGRCAGAHPALPHNRLHLRGNLVGAFTAGRHGERFGMRVHAIRLTLLAALINQRMSQILFAIEGRAERSGDTLVAGGKTTGVMPFRSPPAVLILTLALLGTALTASAADTEFRGAWVATVHNIDWPSAPGLSAATQKAELRAILNRAAEVKLTAILLQVRPASDALYSSKREPWSQFLTGIQGVSPGYDPLEFAIAEAHARGLELHAWINPFRAASNAKTSLAANHVAKQHPEWVRRFGAQLWVDPGEPEARDYVLGIIADIVQRYEVDGVHIDDYFYPYPVKGESFPDDASWDRFGAKSGLSRADWRRENINDFVRRMYRRVKAIKPAVQVGISPFGIWRPGVPATIEAQLDAYGQLFADSRKWLAEGWCDYLAPQLYWSIRPAKQSFPVLLEWWRAQSRGKPVWPGLATERIGAARPAREILDQIAITRRGTNSPGHIHWSMKALMQNRGEIGDLLRSGLYADEPGARE